MITVISGTNRPGSNTRKVAELVLDLLREGGEETNLIDLSDLPAELFAASSYADKPDSFAPMQKAILDSQGILTIVPEYNGSFPGVLKYFIDMLGFPESLYEKPAAFVGISAGQWGAVRAVEHLEMVFQYRHAHLFGRRCFIPKIFRELDENGGLTNPDLRERLAKMVGDFARFCRHVSGGRSIDS
jgi:NAD(P)H-dependent FMN reductase